MSLKTIVLIAAIVLLVWLVMNKSMANPSLGITTMGNGNGASKTVAGDSV